MAGGCPAAPALEEEGILWDPEVQELVTQRAGEQGALLWGREADQALPEIHVG